MPLRSWPGRRSVWDAFDTDPRNSCVRIDRRTPVCMVRWGWRSFRVLAAQFEGVSR